MPQNIKFGACKWWHSKGLIMQDHKAKYKIQMANEQNTNWHHHHYFQWGFTKSVLHNLQYPDGCNIDQGSFIPATSHTHRQKWAVNMTCHHLLFLPDADLSLNCWGGNPYHLVLFSGFNQTVGFVDSDSMKCPSSKPHTVLPWWPFCTGKQKAYAKCTTLSTKYNTTCIQTP